MIQSDALLHGFYHWNKTMRKGGQGIGAAPAEFRVLWDWCLAQGIPVTAPPVLPWQRLARELQPHLKPYVVWISPFALEGGYDPNQDTRNPTELGVSAASCWWWTCSLASGDHPLDHLQKRWWWAFTRAVQRWEVFPMWRSIPGFQLHGSLPPEEAMQEGKRWIEFYLLFPKQEDPHGTP